MSITLNNMLTHVSTTLSTLNESLMHVEEQTSSGSRINSISDAPADAYSVLNLNNELSSLSQYSDNVSEIMEMLESTSTTLDSISDELTDCQTLLTQILGGIYDDQNKSTMGDTINEHLEQLVQLANTEYVNQYLFGGTSTSSAPYSTTRDTDGNITSVNYQGSNSQRTVQIGDNVDVNLFLVGDRAFTSDDRQDGEYVLDNTGSALGTGTSNATGCVWITVTEDEFGDLYISANDGTAVLVDTSDNNMALTTADGETIYIDATNITGAGTDLVSFPGTYNMFETLIDIRDILNNSMNLSTADQTTALEAASDWIGEIGELIIYAESAAGAKTSYLENYQTHLEDMDYILDKEVKRIGNADLTQLAVDLAELETLYEMSLSVASKLLSLSLLDFIR